MQLPLNGRNFLALAQLSDAVVIPPGGTRGEALQQAGPLPNVGGQRSGHNIYLLDGTKVTDELFNNLVINPSVDSIEEFKIHKSMYAAEFGGKASALINVVTRAGANTFRGSAFEFHRDDAFDSPNYFRPIGAAVPPLRQDQFGGTLGGPLRRNRSFFFASFEGLRMKRSLTRTFSVPTAAVRAGNFAGLAADLRSARRFRRRARVRRSPTTRSPRHVSIPLRRRCCNMCRPLRPAPIRRTSPPSKSRTAISISSALRLDHQLTASDQLFARFSTFDAEETQPFGTSALQETLVPGFGRSLTTRTRNLVASHTHTFGTSLLNELRVGWMTVGGGQISRNRGNTFAADVGLLGVTTDPRDMGFPQVSTGGLYSTFGDPTIFTTRNNQHFELFDNITLDRGAHRLKFGAYYFHLQLRPEQPDNARGAFTFTGQFTGNAFADFLLGYPTSAVSGIGRGDENGRTNWLHLYAQDDWQPRNNLTFNLGLRYEFNQHMYDIDNRLSSIDLAGRRFVIASDEDGTIAFERRRAPRRDPHSVRDVGVRRLGTRPDGSQCGSTGAASGLRACAERFAGRHPRRLRHFPESVGVQRADGFRAEPAVLLHEADRRAVRCPCPDDANARHPDQQRHWYRRRHHHGLRLQRRVQPDVERRSPVPAPAVDDGGDLVHGNVDARRGQRDDPERAGAGPWCRSSRAGPFRS